MGTAPTRPVSDLFSGIVSDLTGKVVTTAVQANLRSAERQQELDRRLIPGIPSSLQLVYLALMLGLLGVPVSRAWWQTHLAARGRRRVRGQIGYWAARAMRALPIVLVFLPLTAVVAAPYNLFGQIRDGVMTPVRWWRRLTGRKARRAAIGKRQRPATSRQDGRRLRQTTGRATGRRWKRRVAWAIRARAAERRDDDKNMCRSRGPREERDIA